VNNRVTVVGANKAFLFVAIINIVFSLVIEILNMAFSNFLDDDTLLLLLMIQFFCILFPSLFYLIGNRINIKETLRFNRPGLLPSFLIVLISAPAFYAASVLNSIGYYFLQFIGKDIEETIPVPQNFGEVFVSILVIAVAPALCEEILHRGILLKAYENRGTMKAVVISAVMFGIFHFDITNLLGPIFLGLLFGYYVVRTNSIFAAVIAHFMNNFLATILEYSMRNEEKDSSFYSLSDLGAALLFGAICVGFIFLLLLCFKAATKGKYDIKPSKTTIANDVVSIISHWPVIVVIVLYSMFAGLYILSLAAV
jgi:membrane protease YdiL (CAAX protease family)